SVLRFLAALRESKGHEALEGAIRSWSIDPRQLGENSWISVDSCAELLELVESRFGDGSYSFIRALFAAAGPSFPTIQGELARRMPLTALAERATADRTAGASVRKNMSACSDGVRENAKMIVGIMSARNP